jgi:hypothetical protein
MVSPAMEFEKSGPSDMVISLYLFPHTIGELYFACGIIYYKIISG